MWATCGDGSIWNEQGGNETCDDGNYNATDNCTTECQPAKCGDGFVHYLN